MSTDLSRTVLVVSADAEARRSLWGLFQQEGYKVVTADSLAKCLRVLHKDRVDLMIVDTTHQTSGLHPWEICEQSRAVAHVPCIVIVQDGQAVQRALEVGADDAVLAPVHLPEIAARGRAILRRRTTGEAPRRRASLYLDRDLLIDFETHEVWARGRRINLTPREYALLATMARHAGRVLSPSQLAWSAWGEPAPLARQPMLKQYICRLRKKIEQNPSRPEIIITHRGEGYELRRLWQRDADEDHAPVPLA